MRQDDSHRRLEELRATAQRSSTNLVELEIDPSRRLLEATRLEGRSAERWAEAGAALTELWRHQSLLEGLVGRADRLQGTRHAAEFSALLEGKSIELSSAPVPLSSRRLLDTTRATERCSPDQLLTTMASSFEEIKRTIAELTAPWDNLTPRLEATRSVLNQARQLDHELGNESGPGLERATELLQRLTTQLATDPLSVAARQIDDLEQELGVRRDELQGVAALKREFEPTIGKARELLEEVRSAVAAAQAAHQELMLKVVVPSPPPPIEIDPGLEAELGAVIEYGRQGSWNEASSQLKAWTERASSRMAEARKSLDANRAPVQARNELRTLLEAYQVKAQRLGTLEDRELQDIFSRARDVLYNAPSDLSLATQLVRSYQIALSNTESTRRATG